MFCTNISFSFQYFSMSFFKYLHDASCIPRFWVIQCRNMSSESVGACSPLLCWSCVWPALEVGPEAGLSVTWAYWSVGRLGGQPASYNPGGDFEVRFGSWCASPGGGVPFTPSRSRRRAWSHKYSSATSPEALFALRMPTAYQAPDPA